MKRILNNNALARAIAAVIITLIGIGAVFVFSASANLSTSYQLQTIGRHPEIRQLFFCAAAVILMMAVSGINYKWLDMQKISPGSFVRNPITWALLLSIALLIVVLIPGIGTEVNYARRWLRIAAGPVTVNIQPSELAKWSLVFFICSASAAMGQGLRSFKKGFLPLILLIGLVIGLIVIEDFGTAAFVGAVSFMLLLAAGAKIGHLAAPVPVMGAILAAAIMLSPERMERITSFLGPSEETARSAGYQVNQSLTAISTGGLLGKGLGRGITKYGHLPEDTTDFIFSVIAEELGFVGVLAVVICFVLLAILGIITMARAKDNFARLCSFAITLTITAQAGINLGVVTRLLPTKGIALPFISAGGSHLLVSAAAAGVLINIARNSEENQL